MIAEMADAQRQELALVVERQLDVAVGIAGLVVGQERFRPRDIQNTGRPIFLAPTSIAMYSGYGPVLSPNAPPTSSVVTRIFSGGMPMTPAIGSRMARAPCEQMRVR